MNFKKVIAELREQRALVVQAIAAMEGIAAGRMPEKDTAGPFRKRRGRPPGSKSKKNSAREGHHDVNT